MKDTSDQSLPWTRRVRVLSEFLIVSVTLNAILVGTLIYIFTQKRQETEPVYQTAELPKGLTEKKTNAEVIALYCEQNFSSLLSLLQETEIVEDGYSKRDLALGVLVAFHQLHIEKALGGLPIQRRRILFSPYSNAERIELEIFPGLTEEHFDAILTFARTERWPLTPQGLYFEIKRQMSEQRQPGAELVNAFYLSQEFLTFSSVFGSTDAPLTRDRILQLIAEGNWELYQSVVSALREEPSYSVDCRRQVLLAYLQARSKTAACLLIEFDREFVEKKCNDIQVLSVLNAVGPDDPNMAAFAKTLLCSTRSDDVWKRAAEQLYTHAKEAPPQPYDHMVAIRRFSPEFLTTMLPDLPPAATPVPTARKPSSMTESKRSHLVIEGESLWKISRKYRVSINDLMEENHLETDRLRPGQSLVIPSPKR